jgi:hypothetical protein
MPSYNAAGGVKARKPGGYKMYKEPKRVFGRCDPGNITDEQIARKRAGFPSKLVPRKEEEEETA